MKNIIIFLFWAGMILSCNSKEQTDIATQTSPEKESLPATPTAKAQLQPIDSEEALIATALMAAPKESREDCKVIGYNLNGEFVTLKEGDNEFICLADNPQQAGFSAACYHKDLEAFMARGRELRAEGKTGGEIFEIRGEEIKSGRLKMGKAGSTLHVYSGPDAKYDPESSEVPGATYRYVVYLPWATSESTGLPETPLARNHPWIMDPGTHKAHIMISPK